MALYTNFFDDDSDSIVSSDRKTTCSDWRRDPDPVLWFKVTSVVFDGGSLTGQEWHGVTSQDQWSIPVSTNPPVIPAGAVCKRPWPNEGHTALTASGSYMPRPLFRRQSCMGLVWVGNLWDFNDKKSPCQINSPMSGRTNVLSPRQDWWVGFENHAR